MAILIDINNESGDLDELDTTMEDGDNLSTNAGGIYIVDGSPEWTGPYQLSSGYHLICGPVCDMDKDGTIHIDPNGYAFTLRVDAEGKATVHPEPPVSKNV